MKKNRYKQKRPSGFAARKNIESKSSPLPSQKIYLLIFFLVLLSTIALKIYKADHAGIIFDERANYVIYARSLDTAVSRFDSTNNHVLNSVFMYYAHKFFSFYEHFIRIPSLFAGIMFSLSIAYIVYKTIRSKALQIASLGLVLLVPFVFDYSYLARGYALALGSVFTAIAFVLWLLDHKIKFRFWPIPVLVISLMNFLALGPMLSSLLLLAGFNTVFVLFYSPKIFDNITNKSKPIIINLISISLTSFGLLFLLYRRVYTKLATTSTIAKHNRWWSGWSSFTDYFHAILVRKVFALNSSFGYIIFYVALLLLAIGIIYHAYKFLTSIKTDSWRQYLKNDDSGQFVLLVAGLTMIIMFIYGVTMKRSLGLQRSQVFVIPLILLSGLIILDRFAITLRKNTFGNIIRTIIVITVVLITLRNLPSPYYISSSTMSKPLLRKLRTIDPNKIWNIAFSKKMQSHDVGFKYYWMFDDYKFRILKKPGRHDIYICRNDERDPGSVCLDWDYYSKQHVAVVVNCKLPDDKVVISAVLIKD